MRQTLLREGANELSYEIRGIVKKAEQLQAMGLPIYWENIGDPIQKNNQVPQWMKDIVMALLQDNNTYGYCHSKGVLATREFLAAETNALGGVQITPDDILFFNGLGDAIGKIYQYLRPTARIIGPSPAYSTHSSAEAAHANHHPLTYKLDPDNHWYPDMDDLYQKVKYNPNIVGILIINPDNPTGMVYPPEILRRFVEIAREFSLFLISDEIYLNIHYNGQTPLALAQFIQDVPGIAMRGISKEIPWPGARCGWVEYYNRQVDAQFAQLCNTLDNAKMIEVCATKLPQLALPLIKQDPRYAPYRMAENAKIGRRSKIIADILGGVPAIKFNETFGAFYNTIIFREGTLRPSGQQRMHIAHKGAADLLGQWLQAPNLAPDKAFVYNLLAAKGVCVVPISSFCSDLQGFRVTLLEEDEALLTHIFTSIRAGIEEYIYG
ncbi:pyridoxal phosphate-dependent aminotransferase [Eisenibacter elegans]|jgi:aspartate/methionine/tyrosine aminotransferase|uniref:pyridoxal phosphate-dependent aminotransferase n=1 Tax=Eisenibacter elegans TaxID=997 RepID=UPI0003F88532|nr:pyridoxal phosphate-dependent aminotransferase [Eisenibacter elegans]